MNALRLRHFDPGDDTTRAKGKGIKQYVSGGARDINMYCQKCRSPLKPDLSLEDLHPAAFNLLLEASSRTIKGDGSSSASSRVLYTPEQKKRYEDAVRDSPTPVLKRSIPPVQESATARDRGPHAPEHPSMSFVMLTESQMGPPPLSDQLGKKQSRTGPQRSAGQSDGPDDGGPLSHKMETATRLFEILSSRSDVDHPICVECTEILIDGMEQRLASATKERDAYAEYLKNATADAPTEEERQQVEEEITAIREQERVALAELEELEREKAELEGELALLDREARELDKEEEELWRERNEFTQMLNDYRNERDSLNLRYEHDARQLEKLQRTNVYNDTFSITYDKDGFGTINGLRLGRKFGKNVEWAEINAAWGQALLLLTVVAEKLKFSFKGYRLNPMGSTSTIEKVENTPQKTSSSEDTKHATTSLQLYYSSELPLGIAFLHRHFDSAMMAFLECLRQLGSHIEQTIEAKDALKRLPFEIKKDKIGDVSIRLGFNGDDNWTKACKLTLICCKFCLAHASNIDVPKGTEDKPTKS